VLDRKTGPQVYALKGDEPPGAAKLLDSMTRLGKSAARR
jgi:hypothetical protein